MPIAIVSPDLGRLLSGATLGLFFGIELVKDMDTKEAYSKEEVDELGKTIMEKGVIVRCADSRLSFGPPLTVGRGTLDHIFDAIDSALKEL